MAASDQVYNETTERETTSNKYFTIPNDHLDLYRLFTKVAEVILSFLAFVLEEVVTSCVSCTPLYFFEFVSCTAFLFTSLLLLLLSTVLHKKVGINCWSYVDFLYTGGIAFFFFISALAFALNNGGTEVEMAAVAFGFLATIAFLVDIAQFIMTKGVPFKKSNQATSDVQPEQQKLRSTGTE